LAEFGICVSHLSFFGVERSKEGLRENSISRCFNLVDHPFPRHVIVGQLILREKSNQCLRMIAGRAHVSSFDPDDGMNAPDDGWTASC